MPFFSPFYASSLSLSMLNLRIDFMEISSTDYFTAQRPTSILGKLLEKRLDEFQSLRPLLLFVGFLRKVENQQIPTTTV